MAIVGITLLLLYLGFAYVIYRLGIFLWSIRPSFWTTVWAIIVTALIIGFLSYKFGTVRLLHRLRARELPQSRAPHLYKRLESLTSEMEISTPRLFVANLAEPNAFSLGGRKNGVIILDRSLFRLLHKNELEGIIAHELAHLESRDALLQTLAFSFLRTIVSVIFLILLPVLIVLSGISQGIAWIRGNPWAGSETIVDKTRQYIEQAVMLIFILLTMVILAQSRRREYAADDRAAEVTDKPQA
ncbi:MAG: M48 family metallopeptidase, partial [Halobacteriaceae archaeon]